jgi:hypothetical protein
LQNSEPDNQQRRRKASLGVLRALQSEKAQRVKEELEEQPRKLEQILIKRNAHDGRQSNERDNQQRRRKAS